MIKSIFLNLALLIIVSLQAQNYTEIINPVKGRLLFSDDFEAGLKNDKWSISDKFKGGFSVVDGVLIGKELKDAGHGSVARASFNFSDVIIEFDVKFSGTERLNIVMDDSNCKEVHAGHISRVSFSKMGFKVQDDKTGSMNLKIQEEIKSNPKRKAELKDFFDSKAGVGKMKFIEGTWYHVIITKIDDTLQCAIGDVVATVKSEGIGHPTLDKFGPTITGGNIHLDNFKIWEVLK